MKLAGELDGISFYKCCSSHDVDMTITWYYDCRPRMKCQQKCTEEEGGETPS